MGKSVNEFLNSLSDEMPRCDAERLGAERYGAPRLSSFELLGTNENILSDVLADLLDPRGTHGQGTLFLNALLREIKLPAVHPRDPIQVTREFMTKHRRRIDILIEMPTCWLGIENKPYAGQGENQLIDYYSDLVARADGRKPCLVFLSNSDPETAEGETEIVRFYDCEDGHPSLSGILKEVRSDIRAPRARAFVDDFLDWIKRNFEGEEMTDELEPYVEEVLARFEYDGDRKAIGAVMLAGDRIRSQVIDEIGQHIWDVLVKLYPDLEGIDYELTPCIDIPQDGWTMRRSSWPQNCSLAIMAEKKGGAEIIYGILAASSEMDDPNAEHIKLSLQNVAGGSAKPLWTWYRRAPTPVWSQEFVARLLIESDGQIEKHDDIIKMTADMVRLAGAIEAGLRSS